jgi:predicted HD phosphohydrolase
LYKSIRKAGRDASVVAVQHSIVGVRHACEYIDDGVWARLSNECHEAEELGVSGGCEQRNSDSPECERFDAHL